GARRRYGFTWVPPVGVRWRNPRILPGGTRSRNEVVCRRTPIAAALLGGVHYAERLNPQDIRTGLPRRMDGASSKKPRRQTPARFRVPNLPDKSTHQLSNRPSFRAQLDGPAVLGAVPGVQRNAQRMVNGRGQVLR